MIFLYDDLIKSTKQKKFVIKDLIKFWYIKIR